MADLDSAPRILAIDTSSATCSVALLADRQTAEIAYSGSRTHSRHLMEMIDHALRLGGVRAADLDGIAVARGPGTFTGLRIGISAAKGLALACGKPLLGISCLEALAVQAERGRPLLCAMIDARRGEVYHACFRWEGGGLRRVSGESACPPGIVLAGIGDPCVFVGNGAELYRELILASTGGGVVAPAALNVVHASTLAQMAAERIQKGKGGEAGHLNPVYLRRSDAELRLGPRVPVYPPKSSA